MLSPECLDRGYFNTGEVESYKALDGLTKPERKMALNKTIQELTKEAYEVIGDYHSFKSPIEFKHHKCDKTFEVSPKGFLMGYRCPSCEPFRKGLSMSPDQFVLHIRELTKGEYDVLGTFTGMNRYVKFKHRICGHEFSTLASNFTNKNSRCPNCRYTHQKQTRKKTASQNFKKRLRKDWNGEYKIQTSYQNQNSSVSLLHQPCGTVFEIKPRILMTGIKIPCPICKEAYCQSKRQKNTTYKKRTSESFQEEVNTLTSGEYQLLTSYQTRTKKVWMKHRNCGHHYQVRPADFLSGCRCPLCAHHAPKDLILRTSIEGFSS